MARTFEQQRQEQVASRLSWLGVFLFVVAAVVLVYAIFQHENTSSGAAASYTARQEVQSRVEYFDNSFFGTSPRLTSNAYISELTSSLATRFRSTYALTKSASLTYKYRVDAALRGTYPLEGEKDKLSSVWQKDFVLLDQTTKTDTTDVLTISQEVEVPYDQYRQMLNDFKKTLNVPVDGEVVVTMAIEVSGTVEGTAFRDNQTIAMTLPLTKEIYQPTYKFDKERKGDIMPEQTKNNKAVVEKVLLAVVVLLAASGIGLVVYAKRSQIFKSAYRRELDRIYRYHEGAVVKASRHPDILHKTVVTLQRFEDILSLEEELRSPIIASESGDEATRFMIIKGDVVYMYVLGVLPVTDASLMQELEQAFDSNKPDDTQDEPPKKKPSAKKPRLIQQ